MPELRSENIPELFLALKDERQGKFLRQDRIIWWDPKLRHQEIANTAQIISANDGGFIYATAEDGQEIHLNGKPFAYPLRYKPEEREKTAQIIREIVAGQNIRVVVY